MTEREYILVRNLSHLWTVQKELGDVMTTGQPAIPQKSLVKILRQIDAWTNRILKELDEAKGDDEE